MLRLTARGDDGRAARPGLAVWAEAAGAPRRGLPLSLVAPGAWEAPLDLPPGEAFRLSVRREGAERGSVPVVGPPSAERGVADPDRLPADQTALAAEPVHSRPVWRWLVVLAVLLLPVDALLRRRGR